MGTTGVAEAIKEVFVEESGEWLRRKARELSEKMKMEEDVAIHQVAQELSKICIRKLSEGNISSIKGKNVVRFSFLDDNIKRMRPKAYDFPRKALPSQKPKAHHWKVYELAKDA